MGALFLIGLFLIPAALAQQPAEPPAPTSPEKLAVSLPGTYECRFGRDPNAPPRGVVPRKPLVLHHDGTWDEPGVPTVGTRRYGYLLHEEQGPVLVLVLRTGAHRQRKHMLITLDSDGRVAGFRSGRGRKDFSWAFAPAACIKLGDTAERRPELRLRRPAPSL